jgi:hypothetical protein
MEVILENINKHLSSHNKFYGIKEYVNLISSTNFMMSKYNKNDIISLLNVMINSFYTKDEFYITHRMFIIYKNDKNLINEKEKNIIKMLNYNGLILNKDYIIKNIYSINKEYKGLNYVFNYNSFYKLFNNVSIYGIKNTFKVLKVLIKYYNKYKVLYSNNNNSKIMSFNDVVESVI